RQRLQKTDQHLAVTQSRDLVLGRLAYLGDRIRAERVVDYRRPGVGVRRIGKRRGNASGTFDQDLEPRIAESSSGIRNQRNSALPGSHFTRNPDPHGASLERGYAGRRVDALDRAL